MARSADLDGLAVVWGLTNKKPNAEACADACRRHEPPGVARGGPYGALPCNAFTFCPVEFDQCFEADAHTHHGGDCWYAALESLFVRFYYLPCLGPTSPLHSLIPSAYSELPHSPGSSSPRCRRRRKSISGGEWTQRTVARAVCRFTSGTLKLPQWCNGWQGCCCPHSAFHPTARGGRVRSGSRCCVHHIPRSIRAPFHIR